MTNAEAIEHLKNIKIYSYQDGYTAEAREALDMAINALQVQEWVPCSERWLLDAYIQAYPDVKIAWKPLPEPYREEKR